MRGQDLKRQKQTSAGRGQEKTRGKMTKEKKKGKSKVNLSLKQEEEVHPALGDFCQLTDVFYFIFISNKNILNLIKT